jgi:hypothetical protein
VTNNFDGDYPKPTPAISFENLLFSGGWMHSFDRETNYFERDSLFIFNRSRVSEKGVLPEGKEKRVGGNKKCDKQWVR